MTNYNSCIIFLLEDVEVFSIGLYNIRVSQEKKNKRKNRVIIVGSEKLPEITIVEVKQALTEMKKNKVAGQDELVYKKKRILI